MDACSQLGSLGMMESNWFNEYVQPLATTTNNEEVSLELIMCDTVQLTWSSKDCLLLQTDLEPRPSTFLRLVLIDLEIFEPNEILPGAFEDSPYGFQRPSIGSLFSAYLDLNLFLPPIQTAVDCGTTTFLSMSIKSVHYIFKMVISGMSLLATVWMALPVPVQAHHPFKRMRLRRRGLFRLSSFYHRYYIDFHND